MKKSYNVLWFDDEYQTLDIIYEEAMLADINLAGFSNAEEGLVELRTNLHKYDAVIVDGLFYQLANETNAKVTQNAMAEVASELKTLEGHKKLPWFILSGQPSFTREKNPFADFFKGNKVYDKLSDSDKIQLWKDLKLEADKQIETQIRHKYGNAFEVCTDNYIGESNHEKLLRILIAIEQNVTNNPSYFNEIRKIMEGVFSCCNDKGFFPAECTEMNSRSLYLCKKEMQDYVPGYIQRNIHSVVQISQEGSHRLLIDKDVTNGNSPYLLRSTTFELLNILLWYKEYLDKYPQGLAKKIEIAESVDLKLNWIKGELAEISDKGWGMFLSLDGTWSIPPSMIKQNGYQIGNELEIITKIENKAHIDKIRKT